MRHRGSTLAALTLAFAAASPALAGSWGAGANFNDGAVVRGCGAYFPDNGKFYVLGGRSSDAAGSDYLSPHEYDPAANTWTTKAATFPDNQVDNMACGVLTLGSTNYIFAVGGSAAGATTATAAVRAYDPVTDTFLGTSFDAWPGDASGTVLPGGSAVAFGGYVLLTIGGYNINVGMIPDIWEFSPNAPAGTQWTHALSTLPVPMGYVPAAADGQFILIGGGSTFSGGTIQDSANSYVFDIYNDTINTIAPIPRATGETRAVIAYGRAWVLGGGRVSPNPANEVDQYDLGTNAWSTAPPFATARRNFPADIDGTGRIFLVGGYDSSGTPNNTMEIFTPSSCAYSGSSTMGASIVAGTASLGVPCDDCSFVVPLPFPFVFNSTAYDSVAVDTNGTLQFGSNLSVPGNSCLPTGSQGFFDAVFPFWDDLYSVNTGYGILSSVSGTAPNRIYNIEWHTQHFPGTGSYDFEVRLHETRNQIDFIYGDTLGDDGVSATAGLQLGDGLSPGSFLQFSCDEPLLVPGRMLTYTPAGPGITVARCLPPNTSGLAASAAPVAGAYNWALTGGTIDSGQGTSAISFTSGPPGTLMTLSVAESGTGLCGGSGSETMQVDYTDVPVSNPFHDFICTIARDGITAGCGSGNFCPTGNVLRSQMAVFLLIGEHGSGYTPPACVGIFADVACPGAFTSFIEELYNEGITGGCLTNPLRYCPGNAVSRAGMAVFLLVSRHGTGYAPPACTGIFTDVACPGSFTNWIEQLYNEGITGGCNTNPLQYCPNNAVSRAAMAVFLTATFSLP